MGNLLGSPITEKETHFGKTSDGLEYGVSSMQGWRIHMEDAHITEGQLYAADVIADENSDEWKYSRIDLPGHSLFAVFDGHGGTFAAAYAGRNLCRVLSRQQMFVQYAKFILERQSVEESLQNPTERSEYVESGLNMLREALRNSFIELDKEIASAVKGVKVPDADAPYHDAWMKTQRNHTNADKNDTNTSSNSRGPNDGVSSGESAIQLLDDEGDSGTTACVVVITPDWVVCANAGDSRAVISRLGNRAIPLSEDHKPDDEAEERRIRAAGGYVAGGRVEGDLAVSRGLGDFRFKNMSVVMAAPFSGIQSTVATDNIIPNASNASNNGDPNNEQQTPVPRTMLPAEQKVSPVPDIRVQSRNQSQDNFVLIACDGIWDVQSNDDAVNTVSDMFNEGESDIGLVCEEFCDVGLRMGSKDNMTVLVVKLAAQKIGEGGGVLARRHLRASENGEKGSGS